MSHLSVQLSTNPPADEWGKGSLSFSANGATIHIQEPSNDLKTIKRAARKLEQLCQSVALEGQWNIEQQWAFATAFESPARSKSFSFVDNADKTQLDNMLIAHRFTCDLINGTPENISPESLSVRASEWLQTLAPDHVTAKAIVGAQLEESGWHGIYQVGRGSERPPVLLEVDYNPTGDDNAPVHTALVGKGITFDSGGYSIKSSEGMLAMKCDMGGAATVTGALGLAIINGLSVRTKLYLCCAENLISGHAYKLGDIITYKNGTTVEIVNTDAEGRLVLADGLMAACEAAPKQIIDAATLTGAAVVAVGGEYNALFTMDEALREKAQAKAQVVNEPVWSLPLEPWHKDNCPSAFADTANSRPQKGGGAGGASNAAGFLSRFVANEGKGWLHIDLAAAYNDKATDTRPVGATAQGIRLIAGLLED